MRLCWCLLDLSELKRRDRLRVKKMTGFGVESGEVEGKGAMEVGVEGLRWW